MSKIFTLNYQGPIYIPPWFYNSLKPIPKIVLTCGCFDPLHIGHIRHLEAAKRLGDVLCVLVTPDKFVNKGYGRPVFPQDLRAEAIAALSCVDYVAINEWPTAVEALKILRPNVYVKGSEYKTNCTDNFKQECEVVNSMRGTVVLTDELTFSSTKLVHTDEVKWLQKIAGVNVMLVGERIVDEYNFVDTLGKSGKEPILAVKLVEKKTFKGGTSAIREHLASLGANVIHTGMNKTIVKERYVERYPFQKLFEVYRETDDNPYCNLVAQINCDPRYITDPVDMLLVADYGHGLINSREIDALVKSPKFLAVNTQTNAGNFGFNCITKYPRADYVCLSERELRLAVRDQKSCLEVVAKTVAEQLNCKALMITRGEDGLTCWTEKGMYSSPALVDHYKDRVGAGDAVFGVTAVLAYLGAPVEVLCRVGNAVGALAVGTIGNQPLDPVALNRMLVCS